MKYFLDYCNYCQRKHRLSIQLCPTCQVYTTPQPFSDKVYEKCGANYSCDGCIAYSEHLAI